MYLTKVELDNRKRATQIAFSTPSLFHGAVERAFEPRQKRNLWTVNKIDGKYYLYLLSEVEPKMDNFILQFCRPFTKAETKVYDPFLAKIKEGSVWRFRLVATPSHSVQRPQPYMGESPVSTKGKSWHDDWHRGEIVAYTTEEGQIGWLMKKAEQNGFKFEKNACRITSSEWKIFRKNKNEKNITRFLLVAYEGVHTVTDVEKFRKALCNGIGREKAFGAGMLTIGR